MAFYDHGAALRRKECADKYDELKKFITSKDSDGNRNEWFLAYKHITDQEKQLEELKEQLEEYKSFFSLMRKLLPRNPSTDRIIG